MDESQTRARMQQVLELVRGDVGSIRTGRATPALVEGIIIEAYGGASKLRVVELATISAPDSQTLVITPWDKTVIGEIKKGIDQANIGFNPVISGEVIRINFAPLTLEDRENYVRLLHQKLENGRLAIRQIRQDAKREKKEKHEKKELSEDEMIQQEKRLQEATDQHIAQIDEIGKRKEIELRSL